jgi:hypothetical protein
LRLKVTSKSYPWTQLLSFLYSVHISLVMWVQKLWTVLRKTGKDDLMKFSLEQLCGSDLCAAQAKKWWNKCDRLCVGYPSQIISLDWGHNVLNNTLKYYYWYSFSFHLRLVQKICCKAKVLAGFTSMSFQTSMVSKVLRFYAFKTFLRITLHGQLLLKIHVKRC